MNAFEKIKVHFQLVVGEDNFPPIGVESLNAFMQKNGVIRLDNTPFFVSEVALGDLVECSKNPNTNGVWFERVVVESGNKALSIIFLDDTCKEDVYQELKKNGCYSEYGEFDGMDMLAVCVYQNIDYGKIREYLDHMEAQEKISYAELCI